MQLLLDERSELERRVLAHDLHAAISPFVRPVAGLDFHRLFIERHKLYCGKEHPLFGRAGTMSRARSRPSPSCCAATWAAPTRSGSST
jgi:LysR family transcriptional regulator, transcriptional activator for bauABCD operon